VKYQVLSKIRWREKNYDVGEIITPRFWLTAARKSNGRKRVGRESKHCQF
jgi:hypothetical protein